MNLIGIRKTDNVEYHGKQGLILSRVGSLRTDSKGVDTCTAEWTIRADRWSELPRRGSPHPLWSYIAMTEREVNIDGPFAVARCTYEGVSSEETDKPEYELIIGVESQPIETHPDFATKIAGTPTKQKHGSMWRHIHSDDVRGPDNSNPESNDNYEFWKFSNLIGSTQNPFAGIENYLDACSVIWRKSVMMKEPIKDLLKAGKVDIPEGPYPRLPGGRNWLNMGSSQRKRGAAYQTTTEWKASSRTAWRPEIYGKAT